MLRLMNCSGTTPSSSNQGPRTELGVVFLPSGAAIANTGGTVVGVGAVVVSRQGGFK